MINDRRRDAGRGGRAAAPSQSRKFLRHPPAVLRKLICSSGVADTSSSASSLAPSEPQPHPQQCLISTIAAGFTVATIISQPQPQQPCFRDRIDDSEPQNCTSGLGGTYPRPRRIARASIWHRMPRTNTGAGQVTLEEMPSTTYKVVLASWALIVVALYLATVTMKSSSPPLNRRVQARCERLYCVFFKARRLRGLPRCGIVHTCCQVSASRPNLRPYAPPFQNRAQCILVAGLHSINSSAYNSRACGTPFTRVPHSHDLVEHF